MAQYLNVRQRKLGTIIIQTVQAVSLSYSMIARTQASGGLCKAQSKLLPNNPARPLYRYTSVPMEAARTNGFIGIYMAE